MYIGKLHSHFQGPFVSPAGALSPPRDGGNFRMDLGNRGFKHLFLVLSSGGYTYAKTNIYMCLK